MEIRQLRTLVHVAELGGFTLAAERLNIAQSALTRQIQALEDELKVRLFRRHGRGVELTAQGAALLERANVILREIDRARAEASADHATLSGEVSFGVPPTVADVMSGELIGKFLELHPQVRLRVVSGYSGYVLDWLQRGKIDIGVIYETKLPPSIRFQPLLVEKLFLIEAANASGGETGDALFADVMGRRLVLPSRPHGLRLLIDGMAAQQGFSIDPVVEVDSLPVQIDLVRRGIGATILPFLPVFSQVEEGVLKARPIISPDITRRLILAHTVDRPLSPAARRFAEVMADEVSALVRGGRWKGVLS